MHTLRQACLESLRDQIAAWEEQNSAAVTWAFILDGGDSKILYIEHKLKEDFLEKEDAPAGNWENHQYNVIGTIKEGKIEFHDEEYMKTFFTSTGQVLDRVRFSMGALMKMQAIAQAAQAAYVAGKKRAKKQRQKQAMQAATNGSASTSPTGTAGDEDVVDQDEVAQRKREKRKAKEARQKERRKQEAEEEAAAIKAGSQILDDEEVEIDGQKYRVTTYKVYPQCTAPNYPD